jgi:hypothetical protein
VPSEFAEAFGGIGAALGRRNEADAKPLGRPPARPSGSDA